MSKTIRDSYKCPDERKHCCGMTLQNEGIGYDDLDELFRNPCDMIFTLEVLAIQKPEEYEKESWQLNEDEKLKSVEEYRLKGNQKFKENNLKEAEEAYSFALGVIEQLMLREKPRDIEWNALAEKKIPVLLNFAQCRLNQKDYYKVIEFCTEVISYDSDNLKAYYRRGKAHAGAWNIEKAQLDFDKCISLDPTLEQSINKELKSLNEKVKLQENQEKNAYKNLF